MAKVFPSSAALMILAGCFTIFAAIMVYREATETTAKFIRVEKRK